MSARDRSRDAPAKGLRMQSGGQSILIWALGGVTLALYYYLARPALDSRRWRTAADLSPNSLLMGAISILFFAQFFRLQDLPALVLAVVFHEYGHVIAYRLAGHRNPVFRLVPFGGVAGSDQLHSTHRESFFISVMGPAFSLALVVIAAVVLELLIAARSPYAFYARNALEWFCVLNLLNLAPFYPLDGGRMARALASAGGPEMMRIVGVVGSAFLMLLGVLTRSIFLMVFAVFGFIAMTQDQGREEALPPMRSEHVVICLATYVAVVLALAYPIWHVVAFRWLEFTRAFSALTAF